VLVIILAAVVTVWSMVWLRSVAKGTRAGARRAGVPARRDADGGGHHPGAAGAEAHAVRAPGEFFSGVGQAWNGNASRQGDTTGLRGGPPVPGATQTFGFEATKRTRDRVRPASCTVDGTACR
jgi:hypothetical protein